MIKNIPSKNDFDVVGASLLDQSWDIVATLLSGLEEAKQYVGDGAEEELYWHSARTKLATALTIAHQGAEFLLKGRIAEVSPLLLILSAPKDWPKPAPGGDGHVKFAQFRTVDAQDLVRLHDGCAAVPLDSGFAAAFEDLRMKRNSIMHSVDEGLHFEAGVLLEEILRIHKTLIPERNWVEARREALENYSETHVWLGDWVGPKLVRELNAAVKVLSKKLALEYFNFDKDRRSYLCPECTFSVCEDEDFDSFSATLTEKSPDCETVSCFICGQHASVTRTDCPSANCPGNVISDEYARCLTCGGDN